MNHYRVILIIGVIEVLIGLTTLLMTIFSVAMATNQKTPNVLIFIIITSTISFLLGNGVIKFKQRACQLLLYFSSVVVLTKFLVFFDIIELNGALETILPNSFKNIVSIIYHTFIIMYLSQSKVKHIFNR